VLVAQKPYKSSPVTGLEWPGGFQEVKVPRFHKNLISYGIFVAIFCISGSYPARETKCYAGSKKE
jgi:hypothetical protein